MNLKPVWNQLPNANNSLKALRFARDEDEKVEGMVRKEETEAGYERYAGFLRHNAQERDSPSSPGDREQRGESSNSAMCDGFEKEKFARLDRVHERSSRTTKITINV